MRAGGSLVDPAAKGCERWAGKRKAVWIRIDRLAAFYRLGELVMQASVSCTCAGGQAGREGSQGSQVCCQAGAAGGEGCGEEGEGGDG